MKKILPPAFILACFGLLLVVQMLVHGQKSSATRVEKSGEQVIGYEKALRGLEAKSLFGENISFAKIDSPIVVVNFWASWCKPCIKEFPSLNALNKKFDGKVKIIGVNTDDQAQLTKVKKMYKNYNLNYQSVLDTEGEIASAFNVRKIPATIVYHKGKVIQVTEEEFDFMNDSFLSLIKSKLK